MRFLSGGLEGKHTLKLYERNQKEPKWVRAKSALCEDGISMVSPSIRITDVLRIRLPLRRVPFVDRSWRHVSGAEAGSCKRLLGRI